MSGRSQSGIMMAALFVAAMPGCEKRAEEVKVYRLVKAPLESGAGAGEESPPASMPLPPSHPPTTSAATQETAVPSASVPAHWEPQPLTEMRKASYIVHGGGGSSADISYVALGGTAGNVLDNVNR
jgi:hypothetical protein